MHVRILICYFNIFWAGASQYTLTSKVPGTPQKPHDYPFNVLYSSIKCLIKRIKGTFMVKKLKLKFFLQSLLFIVVPGSEINEIIIKISST